MYLKKDITGTAKYYTRAFAKATANVTEELTDVGVKFLYKDDNGTTSTRVAVGGKYAISPDTSLELSYRIFDRAGHAYAALTKTVGSATFTLSYGDNVGYEGSDDGHVHEPSWKKWITGAMSHGVSSTVSRVRFRIRSGLARRSFSRLLS